MKRPTPSKSRKAADRPRVLVGEDCDHEDTRNQQLLSHCAGSFAEAGYSNGLGQFGFRHDTTTSRSREAAVAKLEAAGVIPYGNDPVNCFTVGEQGSQLMMFPAGTQIRRMLPRPRVVKGNVIDMDVWWRKLTDEQRTELRAFKNRLLGLDRSAIELEYVPATKALRITYRIKDNRNVSLLEPSCTCGHGGKKIHLWNLTVDCPLSEPLPAWWQTDAA